MADSAGDKTEAPTPRKRQEARDQGRIAKSTDLNSALMLLGGIVAMRWFGLDMLNAMMRALRENLTIADAKAATTIDASHIIITTGTVLLSAVGPILVTLASIAILSNLLQVGPVFVTEPLVPKLDRLNPLGGIGRVFNVRTLMQLVMSLLKLAMVAAVAYPAITSRTDEIMLALQVDGWTQVGLLSSVIYDVGIQLAIALLILALLDFGWQRWKFERDLRMTKQEVKEELRRMDGDPIVKQRRRKMQMAAAMQRIKTAVPKADVIVTNPTELAIAIQYDPDSMAAPRVVAKGADYLAKKIREIAAVHGIPIIERKPLAQALFKTVEVGQEVPEQFYKAIAEILAYVYKLSGKQMKVKPAA